MDRMKTFLKYAIILVLFIIVSEFLITAGVNSSYKDIQRLDNIGQVEVYQAQATLVNGRVKGIITNTAENDLNGKYIRFDLYSERDNLVGRKYIAVNNLPVGESEVFEFFFESKEVKSYEVKIVDAIEEGDEEIGIVPEEWTKPEIILGTIMVLLIFW